jgi:UDPglucose 6-dehydrogenase
LLKDTLALSAFARQAKVKSGIVDAVIAANEHQMDLMVDKICDGLGSPRGKRVAVLGLSFKPNTDDLRAAPALHIIAGLERRGVKVVAFDPVSMTKAKDLPEMRDVELAADAYDAARGAHALAIVTEWNEFRGMKLARLKRVMKKPLFCDLRNIYDPEVESAGFTHVGVGRGRPATARLRASAKVGATTRRPAKRARKAAR